MRKKSQIKDMRLVGISTCFGLTFVTLTLLIVSCFTRGWWVSSNKSTYTGLWERCLKTSSGDRCEKFDLSHHHVADSG